MLLSVSCNPDTSLVGKATWPTWLLYWWQTCWILDLVGHASVITTRAFGLFIAIRWRYNFSGLRVGLRLPTFPFTITWGNLAVGQLRLQLRVAVLQWLCFERWFPASPFTDACGHAVLPGGMSRFSRKPPRELLWKTDSKGPLIGLKKHLTESVSGILLDQSGEVVRLLELTIFGGVWCSGTGSGDFVRLRNHTLPLDRCKFF